MLDVRQLTGGYGNVPIVQNISFHVKAGEFFSIVGPKGSGKSTLLKCMYGALTLTSGEVYINQKSIQNYKQKELAKKVAVLPQQTETPFSYTVKQIVELGRYPHQDGWSGFLSSKDEEMIEQTMKETGIMHLADVHLDTLSSGERQRVLLARAMAQEPDILLLDELTNHLDVSCQVSLLDMLKEWTVSKKFTVICVLHDFNMAAMYSDRVLLMKQGRQKALGKPSSIMKKRLPEENYRTEFFSKEHPTVPTPLVTLVPRDQKKSVDKFIDTLSVKESEEYVLLSSPFYWKTFSSAVIGAGFGWHRYFINRQVNKNYNHDNPVREYEDYLESLFLEVTGTAGMMTAARITDGAMVRSKDKETDVLVYATAGTGNAVDVSKAYQQDTVTLPIGTINIWIFVSGKLTEAAYAQTMMTATEAKSKVLQHHHVIDPQTGTIATGTSTDSIVIAAPHKGKEYMYGGTISVLGKKVGKAVFDAVSETLQNYQNRQEENEWES